MTKPRYSYTVTYGPEEAAEIERIAHELRITPTTVVKKGFLERLVLEQLGWEIEDEENLHAFQSFLRLKGAKKKEMQKILSGGVA